MDIKQVNNGILYKRCTCLFIQEIVTGVITDIIKTDHCVQVKVVFENKQYRYGEHYPYTYVIGYFGEPDKGGLKHLELIDHTRLSHRLYGGKSYKKVS